MRILIWFWLEMFLIKYVVWVIFRIFVILWFIVLRVLGWLEICRGFILLVVFFFLGAFFCGLVGLCIYFYCSKRVWFILVGVFMFFVGKVYIYVFSVFISYRFILKKVKYMYFNRNILKKENWFINWLFFFLLVYVYVYIYVSGKRWYFEYLESI